MSSAWHHRALRALRARPKTLIALGVLAALVLGGALGFGPFVRSRAEKAAGARGFTLSIGVVHAAWGGVVLQDVAIQPEGVGSAVLRLEELDIGVGWGLSPSEVRAHGGKLELTGPGVPEELAAWRERHRPKEAGAAGERRLPIVIEGLDASWTEHALVVEGAEIRRDDEGVHLKAEHVHAQHEELTFDLRGGTAELDPEQRLSHAHASTVELAWALKEAPPEKSVEPQPIAPVVKRPGKPPAEPYRPLFVLPDLHALRAVVDAGAKRAEARTTPGASLDVDDLSLALARGADRVAVGGKLQLARGERSLTASFSSRAAQGTTPLELGVDVPLGTGELVAQLSGGPVTLSFLGVKDGQAGLTDVDRATLSGRGKVVLSSAADVLRFDGSLALRGLAIKHDSIAAETVRGLELGVSAKGSLSDKGVLALDDARFDTGALHVSLQGTAEQGPDHLGVKLAFDVPTAACESLRASVPAALLPVLEGARFKGTFGGKGTLAFDTRALDDLVLRYDLDDRCRIERAPDELDKDRFTHAFRYWALDKDRKPVELESGPGTERWVHLEEISPYVQVAVLTTEDGSFFRHKGFNHAAIRASLIANLKAHRFVRGASTITMQLAKNLFLSREKTLARKLQEIILADYLEQTFTKEEMMELYLNVIEFGPDVYGIAAAADHYFGREPAELDLSESLLLATLLPHPVDAHKAWEKGEVPAHWVKNVHALMQIAQRSARITPKELEDGLAETPVFHKDGAPRPTPRPAVHGAVRRGGEPEQDGWDAVGAPQ